MAVIVEIKDTIIRIVKCPNCQGFFIEVYSESIIEITFTRDYNTLLPCKCILMSSSDINES